MNMRKKDHQAEFEKQKTNYLVVIEQIGKELGKIDVEKIKSLTKSSTEFYTTLSSLYKKEKEKNECIKIGDDFLCRNPKFKSSELDGLFTEVIGLDRIEIDEIDDVKKYIIGFIIKIFSAIGQNK